MRQSGAWITAAAAFAILGGVGLLGVGIAHGHNRDASAQDDTATNTQVQVLTASPTPTTTAPGPEENAAQKHAAAVKSLTTALTKYAAGTPAFSVAVLDKKTGALYAFRGTQRYETASVVKVQVLACLLLHAQDAGGRKLNSTESALAKRMIQASDNNATTSLFVRLGKAPAIGKCNKRLGLTHTTVNQSWGLTKTTVTDQVKLLSQLVSTSGPLTRYSRDLAEDLMSTVEADQDWGVPAVATEDEETTVKNGWLPRSTEHNRWIINTVGRVTGDDTNVSIAVLSHGNASMPGGIALVEKVAKMTRQYLKY